MKTNLFMIFILLFFLISCGDNNKNNVGGENTEADADAFINAYMPEGGRPKVGDQVTYEYPSRYKKSGNSKNCVYFIKSTLRILDDDGQRYKYSYDRVHKPSSRNNNNCPMENPKIKKYQKHRKTYQELIDSTKKRMNAHLQPIKYCLEKSWCSRAEVVSKSHGELDGINAYIIHVKFHQNDGKVLERKSWISKDNLIENVFELVLWNSKTGKVLDFRNHLK